MFAIEIPTSRLDQYTDAFPGPQAALAIASIAAGNTAGQLWQVGQPGAAHVLFLWDKGNNVFYLGGQTIDEATRDELNRFIATQIRPQAIAEGLVRFKVRPLTAPLAAATSRLFAGVSLERYTSFFYGFEQVQPNMVKSPAVDGLLLALIDRQFLAQDHLKNIDEVRNEIAWMWPSLERFYQRGFGVAALAGEEIICWCTAEYVGPASCGAGIATIPPYEHRGVATTTAARFVSEALRRGLKPHWECASWNVASARVAEKVSFTRLETVEFLVGRFESQMSAPSSS